MLTSASFTLFLVFDASLCRIPSVMLEMHSWILCFKSPEVSGLFFKHSVSNTPKDRNPFVLVSEIKGALNLEE